jgi:tRNA threonylcarbamoyladenosine biosynthesis protein TsaB
VPLLVIATSGADGEVGLEGREGLAVRCLGEGAARGRGLLPAVEGLLRAGGLRVGDLEAIVVDVGPGGFTGVRVGVTAAKTLAFALARPAVPVTSLEALVESCPDPGPVLALRDAGRGTVYWAWFGPPTGEGRRLADGPGRRPLDEIARSFGAGAAVVEGGQNGGPGVAWTGPTLQGRAGAAEVLSVGRRRLAEGRTAAPHALVPLYLQASTPEQRLRRREE